MTTLASTPRPTDVAIDGDAVNACRVLKRSGDRFALRDVTPALIPRLVPAELKAPAANVESEC
jgi:hypothetical protein